MKNLLSMTERKLRILLVEDELNLARPLQFNLEQEGYEVQSTPSGKEALALNSRQAFDLIILDLMLEEMDGFEVARQVRQQDQKLPILMLTARSAVQDRIHGLELGADDYIVKPFHLRELLLKIERMLKRSAWYKADEGPSKPITVGGSTMGMATTAPTGPFHQERVRASHQASGVPSTSRMAVVTLASSKISAAPDPAAICSLRPWKRICLIP